MTIYDNDSSEKYMSIFSLLSSLYEIQMLFWLVFLHSHII